MDTHRARTLSRTSLRRKKQRRQKRQIICIAAILAAIVLLCGNLGSGFVSAKNSSAAKSQSQKIYRSIELEHGDTLWDLAGLYMNDSYGSRYEYIKELKKINGLASDEIHAGQYITVVYYDMAASGF